MARAITSRFFDWFWGNIDEQGEPRYRAPHDYEDDAVSEPEPEPAVEEPPLSRGGRWRPRATTREGVDVLPSAHRLTTGIHYPRSFEDAQSLADLFKAGSLLVCDLQAVNEKDRPRLVNFLYGVTYGCDGKSERINEFTFLFAPRLFEVVADRQHGGDRLAGDVPRYSLPE